MDTSVERRVPPPSVVGRLLDVVVDVVVLSFAFWTLLYCLGLPTQWSLWPSGWIWLVGSLGILAARLWPVVRDLRASPVESEAPSDPVTTPAAGSTARPVLALPERVRLGLLLGGLVLVAVSAATGLVWTPSTFRFTWAALVVGMVLLGLWALSTGRVGGTDEVPGSTAGAVETHEPASRSWCRREELGVLAVMVLTGIATAFTHLADTDDPYYLNRSVWVAQHGNASLRDTMFSPEVYNTPYGGGVPIASIESLLGVLAHLTGTLAGTVTYLVAAPVAACLAVLALWRLASRWAPRRPFLVFLGAVVFLMLSGNSMLGNFWIVRIWQGKVIAVAFLMPLIWAYLTDAHEAGTRRERLTATGLLLAAGVAFFGLTPTAVVLAPVMFAAVLLAAIALRSRGLAVGGVAMVLGPIVSGLAVIVFSHDVGGADPVALSARASFVRILGVSTPMVALGLIGLGLAVTLARRGAPAALAGASALAGVLVFAPGVLPLLNAATGSGPILWRMLYVAPIPVLVGLMSAAPLPSRLPAGLPAALTERLRSPVTYAVALVPALAVVLGLAVGGAPVWSSTSHGGPVTVTSSPRWKLDLPALRDVRVLADRGVTGEVLLPPRRMRVLTMYTTEAFPVVPREWFVQNIHEPRGTTRARHVLYHLAAGHGPFPKAPVIRHDLKVLQVDLACVGRSPGRDHVLRLLHQAGYTGSKAYGTLACARVPT